MPRSRRTAIDNGFADGGQEWFDSSDGFEVTFDNDGTNVSYSEFDLGFEIIAGISQVVLWSNGVLSFGPVTQEQIDFMEALEGGTLPAGEGLFPSFDGHGTPGSGSDDGFPGNFVKFSDGAGFFEYAIGQVDFDDDGDGIFQFEDAIPTAFFDIGGQQIVLTENFNFGETGFSVFEDFSGPSDQTGYFIGNIDNFGSIQFTSGSYDFDVFGNPAQVFVLSGTNDNETLTGTSYVDELRGGSGDDVIHGLAGDDYLYGEGDNDQVFGGDGDDYIYGGDGDDSLNGGNGFDTLRGGAGTDSFDGGDGDDRVSYSDALGGIGLNLGNVSLNTGDAAGETYVSIETFEGSNFADSLTGSTGADRLLGLAGNDVIRGLAGNDLLNGGDDDDELFGDDGDDNIFGGNGADILDGGAGSDTIFGGFGNDVIDGGTGADQMSGEGGDDSYVVDHVGDVVTEFAFGGSDTVRSSVNGMTVPINVEFYILTGTANIGAVGNTEDNSITGNSGANFIFDGAGNDILDGQDGDDFISSGVGNDTLLGGGGDDTLYAGPGDDQLSAGDGVDTLVGETGDDMLDGGSNVDTAIVSGNRSQYTVTQTTTGVFEVAGLDGTDVLTNVEFLQFDDETMRLLPGTGVTVNFETGNPADYQAAMQSIRDFDGNALGGDGSWLRLGAADVNGDGDIDQILVNDAIGRFATVGTAGDGLVYFDDHGWAGETRVVGIYIDPLVQSGDVVQGGPNDSQRRFQNDLDIGNINRVLGADDYDGDGFQEVYLALTDGTAYLHLYMHADGNIQYANYQSEQQVIDYLTANGFDADTWADWFPSSAETPSGKAATPAELPSAESLAMDVRDQWNGFGFEPMAEVFV